MSLEINLHNKVAIVTGVTSGIGRGVAKMLAKAGCNVAGCGTSTPGHAGASGFNNIVKNEGVSSLYRQVDVTRSDQLESFVNDVADRFGRIDIIVSNAGVNVFEKPGECTEEQWSFNMELNLAAHWRLGKLSQPHLMKNKGVLIIMTSNHAYTTIPNCFPYNVTKTALTGLVRTLAIDWGPGVRTVGLAPGFIETEGGERWFGSFPDPEEARNKVVNIHPVKRLGSVEEIGGFCAFLASEYAQFISGTTYLIDGGRSAIMQDI